MKYTGRVVLALSMLASTHYTMQAAGRYLDYGRILQVVAKLKALGVQTPKVEAFEKNFKSSYVNSWFLLPREYNKIFALILELLDTADHKAVNQKDAMLNVLEMLDDELKGLINRYGYRKELVALSHKTSELRVNIIKTDSMNTWYIAELKRAAQDILAEALLTDSSAESIERRIKNHAKKEQEKEQKKSQTIEPEPYEETDRKS